MNIELKNNSGCQQKNLKNIKNFSNKRFMRDIPIDFFPNNQKKAYIKCMNIINRLDLKNKTGDGCFASVEFLSKKLGVGINTIKRYIKDGIKEGFIECDIRSKKYRKYTGFTNIQKRKQREQQEANASVEQNESFKAPEKVDFKVPLVDKSLEYINNKNKEETKEENVSSSREEHETRHYEYHLRPKGERLSFDKLVRDDDISFYFDDNMNQNKGPTSTGGTKTQLETFEKTLWFNANTPKDGRNGSKKRAFNLWRKITKDGTQTQKVKEVQEGWERYLKHQKAYGYKFKRLEFFLNPSNEYWESLWEIDTNQLPIPAEFEHRPADWVYGLHAKGYIDKVLAETHKNRYNWQYAKKEFRQACQKAKDDGLVLTWNYTEGRGYLIDKNAYNERKKAEESKYNEIKQETEKLNRMQEMMTNAINKAREKNNVTLHSEVKKIIPDVWLPISVYKQDDKVVIISNNILSEMHIKNNYENYLTNSFKKLYPEVKDVVYEVIDEDEIEKQMCRN